MALKVFVIVYVLSISICILLLTEYGINMFKWKHY